MPKKKKAEEEVSTGQPDHSEADTSSQKPKKAGRGATGYDYSGWGGTFSGGRPPSKTDWDAMSPEERASIGLPDWNSYHAAQQNWRSGFAPGGGNYQGQANLANALRSSGASNWNDISRVLESMGIRNSKEEGQALYRRLQGAFQGNIDPSGRYHRGGDGQWVDVGTSDLNRRGIAGRADYSGNMSGIQAVLAGLAGGGGDEQGYFDRLVSQGDWTEWPPGSGKFFNDPGNDPSKRVWVDRNNLQVQGSGYKSTFDPSQGPSVDYSQVGTGRISDWLAKQGGAADYATKAATAAPYVPTAATPGTVGTPSTPPQGTVNQNPGWTTGAWGVAPSGRGSNAPTVNTGGSTQGSVYPSQQRQPTGFGYNSQGMGQTPFGQTNQRRRRIWSLG